MFRADTGNFNKFLTSLGLLCLGAALLIPYFFFRSTETLSIQTRDLRGMTETGRSALLGRQDGITALEPWVIAGAITLGCLGLLLVVIGGLRLRIAQATEDEEGELRRQRARLEVREMSPVERAKENTERAKSEVEEEGVGPPEGQDDSPLSPRPPRSLEAGQTITAWNSVYSRAQLRGRVASEVERAFREAPLKRHKFKWQVRMASDNDEIRLDGVFESKEAKHPDVILSLRVSPNPSLLRKSARNSANDLIATLSRYQAMTRRPASGWLLTVVPDESAGGMEVNALEAASWMRKALAGFGKASIVRESEIEALSGVFSDLFGAP